MTCSDCTADAVPGRVRCRKCLDRVAGNVRRHRIERAAKGLCLYCPRPREGTLCTCSYHREYLTVMRKTHKAKVRRVKWNLARAGES